MKNNQSNIENYLNILNDLVLKPGISGHETFLGISDEIYTALTALNANTIKDNLGNVISVFGNGNRKILIDAHIDEVGFVVSRIENKEVFLKEIGCFNNSKIINSCVYVPRINLDGKINIKNGNFFFEGEDADIKLKEGDLIGFKRCFAYNKESGEIKATALDNRVVCAALLFIAQNLVIDKNVELTLAFTVGQEINRSPLSKIIDDYSPDFGFSSDAAYAIPVDFDITGATIPVLGKGCAVQHSGYNFVVSDKIKVTLGTLAQRNNILYQEEIPPMDLGKTSVNHFLDKNIPAGVVNIPVRDQHMEYGYANIADVFSYIDLIKAALAEPELFF